MNDPVPIIRDIDDLYPQDTIQYQKRRFERLTRRFAELYGGKTPQYVARSPGRVNLIGEHIDYSLYEVLPMAIAADVFIAVSILPKPADTKDDVKVYVANLNAEKFKAGEFTVPKKGNIEIDSSTLQWTNYFKAGYRGAIEVLEKENPELCPCGMEVLVDGTVPAGGGLSSSAAFVCASALATLRANGLEWVPKKELVELAIVSERSVGVNSGGMDQAASVFSIRGDATSISFYPELYAEALPFPKTGPPITFMIAQSFVAADKHVAAPENYNLRVVECTLAAEVLAADLGLKLERDHGPLGTSLRGFQHAYNDSNKGNPKDDPEKQVKTMLSLTEKHLSGKGYTREDIASSLSMSVPDLEKKFMTKFPVRAERFYLRQRAQHVFTEALRVQEFKKLLKSPPADARVTLLPRLGAILNQSHASSRDVYVHSCPEIDQMCEIAAEAGSYGGRVTGAGWGGCSVHLVPKEKVDEIKAAWEEKYYRKREPDISKEKLAEAVIVSEPGHGAMVYVICCPSNAAGNGMGLSGRANERTESTYHDTVQYTTETTAEILALIAGCFCGTKQNLSNGLRMFINQPTMYTGTTIHDSLARPAGSTAYVPILIPSPTSTATALIRFIRYQSSVLTPLYPLTHASIIPSSHRRLPAHHLPITPSLYISTVPFPSHKTQSSIPNLHPTPPQLNPKPQNIP